MKYSIVSYTWFIQWIYRTSYTHVFFFCFTEGSKRVSETEWEWETEWEKDDRIFYFGRIIPEVTLLVLGIVHPKAKIVSSFTHPPAVPNLYTFPSHVEQKIRYFEEPNSCLSPLTSIVGEKINWSQWGPSTVRLQHSSKYLIFCSTNCKERNSYMFVTTQGWVND